MRLGACLLGALVLVGGAAAADGSSGTYLVQGSTFYFDLANTGTTAWEAFFLVAPAGTSFVGGATAGENTAHCVVGQPDGVANEIECGPLSVAAGVHVSFVARMSTPVACGSAFQLDVSSTSAGPFAPVGDATLGGSCSAVPPAAIKRPALHGTPTVGHTLTATPPGWSSAPARVAYRWERCVRSRCVAIASATTLRLELTRSDAGRTVRIVATAVVGGRTVRTASSELAVRRR